MLQMNLNNTLVCLKTLYTECGATEEDFNGLLLQLPGGWAVLRSCVRFFLFFCQNQCVSFLQGNLPSFPFLMEVLCFYSLVQSLLVPVEIATLFFS